MFSTCKRTRDFLKVYTWGEVDVNILVVNSFRDLGSHLNLTNAANGSTLTQRLRRAARAVRRLAFVPISLADKELVIRSTILPGALYGCEAADISNSALQALRSAIASCIGTTSARRSVDATFAYMQVSKDLDPQTFKKQL